MIDKSKECSKQCTYSVSKNGHGESVIIRGLGCLEEYFQRKGGLVGESVNITYEMPLTESEFFKIPVVNAKWWN